MGCFKLPIGLCNEIEAMARKFWWGQRGEKRKIHWLKWSEMTKSKSEGGMGFCDLALHNDSLLAKQAWRLLHDQSSLFYKVFKPFFFRIAQSWRQPNLAVDHMLGKVYYMAVTLSNMEFVGE